MLISLLATEPLFFLVVIIAIAYAITIHEFAHVFAAYLQGDDTGRLMGRLTLNPLAHLDPIGSVLLLVAGFGWGRPAPYNPHNLKYKRWGETIVALAGPFSNLVSIAVFLGVFALIGPLFGPENLLTIFLLYLIFINALLMLFNLIPIPPLDGSKLLFEILPERYHHVKVRLAQNGPWILLMLIIADNFLGINIFGNLFGWVWDAVFFRLPGVVF